MNNNITPQETENQTETERLYAQLEKDFISYEDLCRVVSPDGHSDAEGFSILPVIGTGVIGRYAGAVKDMETLSANIIVRETVYKMLCRADTELKKHNENWQLLVLSGYRSMDYQQAEFDKRYKELKPLYEGRDKLELLEAIHRTVAVPDVSGHPTGGAVDVTVFDFAKNAALDMGTTPLDYTTKKRYYASFEITGEPKENRKLLRDIMTAVGFAPYDGEWWHFSYGDKEWACYTHQKQQEQQIKDTEIGEQAANAQIPDALYKYTHKKPNEIIYVDKYRAAPIVAADNDNLRLAIQKGGRLTDETINLLQRSGIDVVADAGKFFGKCRNFKMDLVFVRDDDIPALVEAGAADIGVVGENVIIEQRKQSVLKILTPLGFGHCSLALAVPNDSGIKTALDLKGKTIATSYRNSTVDFLESLNVTGAKIVDITGSVEIAPSIGFADAIVDLVSTGNSLRQNNLHHLQTIYESQSVLAANPAAMEGAKRPLIDKLLQRFESTLKARRYKSLSFICPASVISEVRAIKAPVAVFETPHQTPGAFYVRFILEKDTLWDTIDTLKTLKLTDIFIFDVEGYIR